MVTANVHDPFADSFGLELRGEGVVMTWCGEPQEKRTRKMNVFLWIFGYPETSRFLLAGGNTLTFTSSETIEVGRNVKVLGLESILSCLLVQGDEVHQL